MWSVLSCSVIFHETKDGSACKIATASFFGVARGCGQTLLRRYLVSSSGGSFTCSRFEIRFVSVSHSVTRNLVQHMSPACCSLRRSFWIGDARTVRQSVRSSGMNGQSSSFAQHTLVEAFAV